MRGFVPTKRLLCLLAALLASSPALAAGINSRAYSCSALQALLAQKGFVFIGNPDFQDFARSPDYPCDGDSRPQPRSVPTTDNPECVVNYCIPAGGGGGGG